MTSLTRPASVKFDSAKSIRSVPWGPQRKRDREARGSDRLRNQLCPILELMEDRCLLTSYAWNLPTGGDWDTPLNWSPTGVPTAADTATINLVSLGIITHNSSTTDSVLSLTTNSFTTLNIGAGSIAFKAAPSTINGPITVGVAGTLQISGTTLIGSGNVTVSGHFAADTSALVAINTTLNAGSVFAAGSFAIGVGASLNVGGFVNTTITASQTITVNLGGTLSFAAGDVVTFGTANYVNEQITVNGSLSAVGTTFATFGNDGSTIVVNSGAHFTSTNSNFTLSSLSLDSTSVYGSGDLVGNTFNMPIFVPGGDVQYLSANARFGDININAATLGSGTLALNLIGTNTSSLRYVFNGGFTVGSGATVSVGNNVPIVIGSSQTILVNGTLSFTTGDVVTFGTANYVNEQITVNGSLTAVGTTFATFGNDGSTIVVNGKIMVNNQSKIALSSLTINSGAIASLSNIVLGAGTVFNVNSNVIYSVAGNDFSSLGNNGVVALGDKNATIDFRNNYWGTTDGVAIEAKILHHFDDATRPTVLYSPNLSVLPASIVGIVFSDLNGNGSQDSGEQGRPGVTVYIDANNNGVFDVGEMSTVTQVDDPSTPSINESGLFQFNGLGAGTFIVRQLAPGGSIQTSPSAAAVATTVFFDGTGAETGITGAGIGSFSYQCASFSGGTIFAPTTTQAGLHASGSLAYNASTGAAVDFNRPIGSTSFFFVHGLGFASGTATAYAADGSTLGSVGSKLATTLNDPANFVSLSYAQPIARIVFSAGIVDNLTFTTQANNQAYFVKLQASQTSNTIAFGDQIAPGTFYPTIVKPTTTGFTATFSAPLVTTTLNLYDTPNHNLGSPDVALIGQTGGTVRGSLIISQDQKTVTFVKTGNVLLPDIYTITLVSGNSAFTSSSLGSLDGNGDGVVGDNYVGTFTVAASSTISVGIPDFARGPGNIVNAPNDASPGLPIQLSNGLGVVAFQLTIAYDPTLLTITGANLGADAAAGASVAIDTTTTPGLAAITYSAPTAMASGVRSPVLLVASVPNSASAFYRSKEVLHIGGLQVFGLADASIAAVADDAVHVNAYVGDVTGNGLINSSDVSVSQQVLLASGTGFASYRLLDPTILGDVTGNGVFNSSDISVIQRFIGNLSQTSMPARVSGLTYTSAGADPVIFLPKELVAIPGSSLEVPVGLIQTDPLGRDVALNAADLVIAYDPTSFDFIDARAGGLTGGFDVITAWADTIRGVIYVSVASASTTTLHVGDRGVLLYLDLNVRAGASLGSHSLNLLASADLGNLGGMPTSLNDGNLVLGLAPTNSEDDPVDGSVMIESAGDPISLISPLALLDLAIAGLFEHDGSALPSFGIADQFTFKFQGSHRRRHQISTSNSN